jgi:predicted membrane-bound mannosyltransferase
MNILGVILIGVVSGLLAAATTLILGSTIWHAVILYVMFGTGASVIALIGAMMTIKHEDTAEETAFKGRRVFEGN